MLHYIVIHETPTSIPSDLSRYYSTIDYRFIEFVKWFSYQNIYESLTPSLCLCLSYQHLNKKINLSINERRKCTQKKTIPLVSTLYFLFF